MIKLLKRISSAKTQTRIPCVPKKKNYNGKVALLINLRRNGLR